MKHVQKCSRTFLFFEENAEPTTFLLMRAADQVCPHQEEGPGGKVEPGETSHEAAIREIKEETGIQVYACPEDFFHCGDTHFENHLGAFQESLFFLKLSERVDQVIFSKEHCFLRKVPYSLFFSAQLSPRVKEFLLKHKDRIDRWILDNFPKTLQ